MLEATLYAGDVLVLPAFWTHYVLHHRATDAAGHLTSCVAVTYTRHDKTAAAMRPLAVDVAAWWRERVRRREADPEWHTWRSQHRGPISEACVVADA